LAVRLMAFPVLVRILWMPVGPQVDSTSGTAVSRACFEKEKEGK